MGEVKVDIVGLQPLQRRFHGLFDPLGAEACLLAAIVKTDLGDDYRIFALHARLLQPFADDRLGLAAHMSVHPGGIDIRRVDGVEPGVEKGVEQRKGSLLIRCPAEHVTAENDRGDGEAGAAEASFFHGECSCCCLGGKVSNCSSA